MTPDALQLAQIVADLGSLWIPHPTQILPIQAVFRHGKRVVMIECGRKWGKTEYDCYFLWRMALTVPGEHYFFFPLQNQGREIVWESGRLEGFGPSRYIASVNNVDMRITFKNGSFIKVDGSDNFNKYRGPNPSSAVYDEFRDFRPEFHRAFGPNLAPRKAPLVVNGSPPEVDLEHYDALLEQCKTDPDYAYFNYPTWANPHNDRAWLRKEKRILYARGEGDVWEREYAARRVRGGASSIFPMANEEVHVVPHEKIMSEIWKDRRKLHWFVTADPGNATVFAMLLSAVNPYSRRIYHLGEIYETEQKYTSTSSIIPRMRELKAEVYPNWDAHGTEWLQTADEAAAWFITEAASSYDEGFVPTQKAMHDKDQGLSLIKDQMIKDRVLISDRCPKLWWEVQNYIKGPDGKPRKKNDHLIDCWRYVNAAAGLSLESEDEPEEIPREQRRGHAMEAELAARRRQRQALDGPEQDVDYRDILETDLLEDGF